MKFSTNWLRTAVSRSKSVCAGLFLICQFTAVLSQDRTEIEAQFKEFQLSLFPGISSNGMQSWKYNNKYSINLFGGLSAGNRIFELGLISNVNLYGANGIQIAGLANIVGANAFANLTDDERRTARREGFAADTHALQLAGFMNFVTDNAKGFQIAGGFNIAGENMEGLQLSLIGNAAGGTVLGSQISMLYNISGKSTTGIQISGLINATRREMSGLQIALINKAKSVNGQKSITRGKIGSAQIGLFNYAKKVNGIQIGLINFGGSMRGTQIGLINFFSTQAPKDQVKNGTPIGLINIGSSGPFLRVSTNEVFLTNLEFSTGNCSNCSFTATGMPFNDKNKKYNQNSIIVSIDNPSDIWGIGYGFRKLLISKYDMTANPKNGKKMLSYGIQFTTINEKKKIEQPSNLLSKISFEYGKRWKGVYIFGGVSMNLFLESKDKVNQVSYAPDIAKTWIGEILNQKGAVWAGYSFGIQL